MNNYERNALFRRVLREWGRRRTRGASRSGVRSGCKAFFLPTKRGCRSLWRQGQGDARGQGEALAGAKKCEETLRRETPDF